MTTLAKRNAINKNAGAYQDGDDGYRFLDDDTESEDTETLGSPENQKGLFSQNNPITKKQEGVIRRRTEAFNAAKIDSMKADTEATKQATAAKANEMARSFNAPGTSYHRNDDGTYTRNAPLSPDAQSDSPSPSQPSSQASSAIASSVSPSRLDAFKASQNTQTANEKLNGIAAGTGPHSWDANNPQNEARAARIAQAVQSVKDAKVAQGINPATNEYVGTGGGVDITGSVRGNLDQSAATSADISQGLNSKISSSVKSGDLSGALSMQPGADATNRASVRDTNISNSTNNVTMTPYGMIATSDKPLGVGGLERLMATPAVQDAAKNTSAPAAMAAVTPSPTGSDKSSIALGASPQQVKQAAYTKQTNPLFGAVSPKQKKPLVAA